MHWDFMIYGAIFTYIQGEICFATQSLAIQCFTVHAELHNIWFYKLGTSIFKSFKSKFRHIPHLLGEKKHCIYMYVRL